MPPKKPRIGDDVFTFRRVLDPNTGGYSVKRERAKVVKFSGRFIYTDREFDGCIQHRGRLFGERYFTSEVEALDALIVDVKRQLEDHEHVMGLLQTTLDELWVRRSDLLENGSGE